MGAYRRRIRLTPSGGAVAGELEDDFHHFGVVVEHDGSRVTAIRGDAVRFPWSTCPGAVDALAPITGAPLSTRLTTLGQVVSARENCTHLFDVAGLAIAHAARGGDAVREYDVEIPDRSGGGDEIDVRLRRDGRELLRWTIVGNEIVGPPPYAGRHLKGAFLAWAEDELEPDEAEAAIVLRRACHISWGRAQDLDRYDSADELLPMMADTCFTFRTSRAPVALRIKGSVRDFTDREDDLLAD